MVQWIECQPVNQKVAGLIPNQGTCLGYGSDHLGCGGVREATDLSVSLED